MQDNFGSEMRTVPKWVNKIHEADKVEFSNVHTICFSPDGTQLVVGAGEKVMVYDPRDGSLVQLLQAHKGAVHAVAYCGDGKKFSSGSADKNVIIWTSKMEGILKYSHSEAIQCLAYNPVTLHLASCALTDFAFWSADVKAVQKYRVSGRITCCAWAPNGQHLAIGLANGSVSIRDKTGDEIQKIVREAPVWALTFSKSTLLITDWDDTLSFYNLQGQATLKERNIDMSALSISMLGALVLVGGLGGWAILTAEGVPILKIPQEWVWTVAPSPALNTVAVGCQDGTLWCYQVVFSTVHGLYRERYAYRENMTDVIIQHLTTGNKVRIKCHDRVQKIAIYKHRLAVQLPERVVVYEQGDSDGMLYRVKDKLTQKTECSLLVATSEDLLLCQDTKLVMIGKRIPRTWTVPSPIRYVKVTTLYFEEILLLGLMNGQIWQVEPKHGSSKVILQTAASVRCLDVSASRNRLAVVDESSVCRVYSLPTGELMYTEENVSSVSWNSWCDELLGLSGNGLLSIKASNFPSATQPVSGSVVGFQGGRVFCLQANSMQTLNVPLSHAVHQYLQHKMFNEAYSVACLGVTALDWERLGMAALEEISFEVARKAFQRSENIVFLTLIDQLQERVESGEKRDLISGEVFAYRGRYSDAARCFHTATRSDRALDMYLHLRMFNKAQELVSDSEAATVARRRAEWAQQAGSPRAAAELFLAAGDVPRAVRLLATHPASDMLIELARKLDKGSTEALTCVAEALVTAGEPAAAAHVFQRLQLHRRVAQLAVSSGDWSRAFGLAREHSECRRDVYLPYANKMANENKFVEAQKAYHMAGETKTALRVFNILVNNAIVEERFSDAGYLHHLLASQFLEKATKADKNDIDAELTLYKKNERLSRIYHAYDSVHKCIHEPFSLNQPEALFNAARFVLAMIDNDPPRGVSMFCLYLCLAKHAKALHANSLAKQMLDKMLGLQIPPKFQESVELLILRTRACHGESRDDEVSGVCWRCRSLVPPLVVRCQCRHALVLSPHHEVLPLVEFVPEEGISHEEAMDLIERTPLPETAEKEEPGGGAQILKINHLIDSSDPFVEKFDEEDESSIVVCTRNALLQLNSSSVIIVVRPPLKPLYYRNMLPELRVTSCPQCNYLFYMEDYEIQLVTKGQCPFCRHAPDNNTETGENSLVNGSNTSTPRSPSESHDPWS